MKILGSSTSDRKWRLRRFDPRISIAGLLLWACHAASAKDIVLTITSDPSGANVAWNGRNVGTTPYTAKFPGGYFHQTQWVISKNLQYAINITLSAPGYEPDQFEITDGPYDRRNLNGQSFGQFWIIKAEKFHRRLTQERTSAETAAIDNIRQGQSGQSKVASLAATGMTKLEIKVANESGKAITNASMIVKCLKIHPSSYLPKLGRAGS